MPSHTKCCTCHAKSSSANLKIWCSKMQPLSGNQRPDLLTSLMNMSLVLRLPREMHLWRILFKCPTPAIVFGNATKPSRFAHFWQGAQSLAPATRKSERPKVTPVSFLHFWPKCGAKTWRALFRHVATSKSGPELCVLRHSDFEMCFAPSTACTFSTSQLPKVLRDQCGVFSFFTFWLPEMCFVPQRRALFQHLNGQKCSDPGVFCTSWLRNVLRATTACNFSSLIWPDGSAPAALASLLFDPREPANH